MGFVEPELEGHSESKAVLGAITTGAASHGVPSPTGPVDCALPVSRPLQTPSSDF